MGGDLMGVPILVGARLIAPIPSVGQAQGPSLPNRSLSLRSFLFL